MKQLTEHPLRRPLSDEVHARPYGMIATPARISHLAMLTGEGARPDEHESIGALCRHFGVAPPTDHGPHLTVDLGGLRLKWERHTEFSTYTFIVEGRFDDPFEGAALDLVPDEWLAAQPSQMLVGVHVTLEDDSGPERSIEDLSPLFDGNTLIGSDVLGTRARIWTDFRLHDDGFGRILVRDRGLNSRQTGRLIQRLLEIETYRMMALLAFPLAREVWPRLSEAGAKLGRIISEMGEGGTDDRTLLDRLTRLAGEAEQAANGTGYRFAASRAYYRLVQRRVEELRESRIEGLQPPGEFIDRRLAPAMATMQSVAERQDVLAEKIARATSLLRTRVDVALQEQNAGLLQSMDRRAAVQLRLQETVEGLSVVAISYYLLGLVAYLAKGLIKAAGLSLAPDIFVLFALPFVVALVWTGVRRLRKAVAKEHLHKE